MSVSPIDSSVYGGLFTTPAMRAVFSDEARLQRMLDVEAALARAQAKLGLIPAEAAREITAKADVSRFDLAAIGRGTELVGYPIVPLVKALGQACAGDAGRWVHWGATTQDIMDTGLVLQLRDGARADPPGSGGQRGGPGRPGAPLPRHADGRAHPRPACAADHLRLQVRAVARALAAPCRAARPPQVRNSGGAVRRGGRHARLARRGRHPRDGRARRRSSAWARRQSPGTSAATASPRSRASSACSPARSARSRPTSRS